MEAPETTLRVNQLDAARLDSEILSLLTSGFASAFRLFHEGVFDRWRPEVDALLRLVVWRYTTLADRPSPGDSLQNVKYRGWPHERAGDGRHVDAGMQRLPARQKYGIMLLTIVLPWAVARLKRLMDDERWEDGERPGVQPYRALRRVFTVVERAYEAATLVNLVVFLKAGVYRSVADRLLRLRMHHVDPTLPRQISFELMDRQLYWHSFTDLLLVVTPLVNLRRVRLMLRRSADQATAYVTKHARRVPLLARHIPKLQRERPSSGMSAASVGACGMCGASPMVCAHRTMPCGHMFCYYCIAMAVREGGLTGVEGQQQGVLLGKGRGGGMTVSSTDGSIAVGCPVCGERVVTLTRCGL
ncbi:unnamed protein product [Vitrella brassicaformis CCMP3155]|uniref:RING-type E3 ubiquitin transferase (cysteine targeting) n=2 Tax=Vitrella brassicaformis TaxID=1169539 RepID=A0A0G4EVR5_VITBC|nr:unnamed protein product [Vitrella brassicaformis CCMP3155]|eukprot:CEM02522.1 unnamed protein product [Vitrella brassicaformis CCMP3155]